MRELEGGDQTANLPDWMVEDCLALGIIEEGNPGFFKITEIGRAALKIEQSRDEPENSN